MLSRDPPTGGGWIHEIKHDGFRTLLRVDRGKAQAFSRGGHDWSDKYSRVSRHASILIAVRFVRNERYLHLSEALIG
jgi:bifunctional non-homologous end joining protein LigD